MEGRAWQNFVGKDLEDTERAGIKQKASARYNSKEKKV